MSKRTNIPLKVAKPPRRPITRAGKWRMTSLITVHVLMLLHIAYWLKYGSTITPVEPSESMETLKTGAVNAGFIFFAISILLTLIFGRFVCGWACHFVAYQDLCGWILKRIGIQPKPLRSRLLMLVPLGMAIYMFAWPVIYRWYVATIEPTRMEFVPQITSAFTTEHFWETFPGWVFAILTLTVAGFSIVYFLGNKGFCTYACPYGGVFAVVEKASPLRVRVSDSCVQTGECTKACGSNVRVAEEVLAYGMVVDPGCMKCADCISSCPTSALSFGFGPIAIGADPKKPEPESTKPSRLPWIEELILIGGFGVFLFAWWGLYGRFPFLMSAGISGMFAYVLLQFVRMIRSTDVSFQNLILKNAGKSTLAGKCFLALAALLLTATAHNAAVQYQNYAATWHYDRTGVVDDVAWTPQFNPQASLPASAAEHRDKALEHFDKLKRWGIFRFPDTDYKLTWLHMLNGDLDAAEQSARSAVDAHPHVVMFHVQLARVSRKRGKYDDAIKSIRHALTLDHSQHNVERELGQILSEAGRKEQALEHYKHILEHAPNDAQVHYYTGALALDLQRFAEADKHLREAIKQDPQFAQAREQLALLRLSAQRIDEAIEQLEAAIKIEPTFAQAQYNLAVAYFMKREFAKAIQHAEIAQKLDPQDITTKKFLQMLRQQTTTP
ncbi:MAG: hypothetical protein DHS20C16_08160 [Phycisphaerae bacterium]|nr:MAG: hypothetical protein DHS20C16_08160 [Phycisphaerae bacterium]